MSLLAPPRYQGRRTALRPCLTEAEWEVLTLTQVVPSPSVDAALRMRSRLVLLLAQGYPITAVAVMVGLSRVRIYKWVKRWHAEGLAGLRNRRGGRRKGASKWA